MLDREQIEQALEKALSEGPQTIDQQVRLILALSQMQSATPTTTPYAVQALSVGEARISATVRLKHNLEFTQIKSLFRDLQGVENRAIRWLLMLDLATELPTERRNRMIAELWPQINALTDPLDRSRCLLQMIPLLQGIEDQETMVATTLASTIKLAQTIENVENRVRSLVILAGHLPEPMRVDLFHHILDEVDETHSDQTRANAINAMAGRLPLETEARVLESIRNIISPGERVRALISLARTFSAKSQTSLRDEAIRAIAQIRNDDERADALINFAPHMESASESEGFPAVLEQALGIAVTFSRRQMRARSLVALAPHLTLDLQGEALAAVHSLSNERDRAELLAELAPTLPPNMLVASLAVAHTMREQDARVHALTVLAHYAPEHARTQTVNDALAAATNLQHHYERVTALIALVDVVPLHLRDQVFTSALEATRLIDNDNARARALSLLGAYLPEPLLNRALEAAYQIDDLQQRLNALIGIVPRLSEETRYDPLAQMIESARVMPFEYKRARALTSIAPYLSPELIKQALLIAADLEDAFDRVTAFIALAQGLSQEDREQVINRAWHWMMEIEDGYDHASALAAIAPYTSLERAGELANQASDVIRTIPDEYDQASAISILAYLLARGEITTPKPALEPIDVLQRALEAAIKVHSQHERTQLLQQASRSEAWGGITQSQQYELWRTLAPHLTTLPLADALLSLGALMPALSRFVDKAHLKDIAHILGLR